MQVVFRWFRSRTFGRSLWTKGSSQVAFFLSAHETHERESSAAFCVFVIAMDPNVLRVAPPQQHGETTSSSSPATTRNPAVTPRALGGRSVLP